MGKIKVLFLAANPAGTIPLKLDEEIRAITQKIRASQYRDVLKLESLWAVRPDDLLQSLNEHKPQIVHFSGHGSRAGEISLVDNNGSPKAVSREALKALFTTLRDNIQIVILNACYSRLQAEAITEVIGCVIGMNDAIGDQAAITFAASFYRAIGFGRSIQDAFDQGKTALLLEGIPEDATPELLIKGGVDPSQLFLVKQQIKREREGTNKTIKSSHTNSHSNQPPIPGQLPKTEPIKSVSADNVKKSITTPLTLGTLLCTYQDHTAYVNALAWSSDGTCIASGSSDHTVQVWDASNGQKVFSYRGHLAVYALVWSPHGMRVLSGGQEGEIQEWDILGKYKVFTYQGHSGAISALAFSPDGTRVASASWEKTVRIWDVATRQSILTFRGHSDWVKTLSWSPDSSCIASGGSDKTVQIWNAANGRNIFTYHSHNNPVECIAWSPDGTRIASGGLDKTIQIWDATTGNLFSIYRGHTHSVQALAWSPDGTRIASASWDKTIQMWDVPTAHCIFSYQGHSGFLKAVAWSPDGTRIASASEDGTVHVWQAVTLSRPIETLKEEKESHRTATSSAARDSSLFEEFVVELLNASGFTNVAKPERADQGFDLEAVYFDQTSTGVVTHQRWMVEVKYYQGRVGRADLDQLAVRAQRNQVHKVLLVTNTNLTSFARELVAKINLGAKQKLEVWDGEKLSILLAQFPKLQRKYSTINSKLLHMVSPPLEPKQISLVERLTNCQPGQQDAYKYEDIGMAILTEVFVPPLKSPKIQARTLNGLERRDALFSLRGVKQGWEEIRQDFEANFILCEFKNYAEPLNKDEVNQTRNYLKHTIGKIGIIFSRKSPSPSAMSMRNSVYAEERKVILFFEDKHLIELLNMKENGQNPLDLIQDAIDDFYASYE